MSQTIWETLTVTRNADLRPFTTLRAGGPAERLVIARSVDELANTAIAAQEAGLPATLLGWGSNVLPSDRGVPGIVIINAATSIEIDRESGKVEAAAGCGFQELFLKTAQANLKGLSFAVGIPGTLGGALVSNAGAYRQNIADFVTEIEIVEGAKRRWVEASWMEFGYRDSRMRRNPSEQVALLNVRLQLSAGDPKEIYEIARENQRQRISKQPAPASAGSFFKNVNDAKLAESLDSLPSGLRSAGVVPAGYLIEAVGMKGYRHGGAMLGARHANFMLNVQGATATEIRELAQIASNRVADRYSVALEEEVLYLGNWVS